MSYHSWTVDGFGICVDDIYRDDTITVEKLLNAAAMDASVLKIVQDYIEEYCKDNEISKEDMTVDDFEELEGEYCERGIAFILNNIIKEITVEFADDYNGTPYILYTPSYPWSRYNTDENLTKEKVEEIFTKYVKLFTDIPVTVDYYSVENGG